MTDGIATPDELIARARALAPIFRENQEATEANRRVSQKIFEQILDAGRYDVLLPSHYGGCEYGLDVFASITRRRARAWRTWR